MNIIQNLLKDQIEYDYEKSLVYLCLRIILGIIFVYHGYNKLSNQQKLANWTNFICSQNLPSWLACFSAVLEVIIGFLLIVGMFTKMTCIIGILFMITALYLAHRKDTSIPIYQILIISMLIILGVSGPGKFRIPSIPSIL